MIYVFDLDGTLLTDGVTHGIDLDNFNEIELSGYAIARPLYDRIEHLRKRYNEGHTIVIQTARSKFWEKFTIDQLKEFDIPYHVLSVGDKLYGDVYVDDKGINANDFFKS